MNKKKLSALFLSFLAIIFTLGLTFASIEFPKIADEFLHQNLEFVNVHTGGGDIQELKTELFITHFHLRTIGYISLFIIVALIIVGFVTEKTGLTSLGAFAIFLPVFGHFAATMFFLGGLGFLRLLWLPGLDISLNIMNLGDAVFIPYRIIIDSFNLIGLDLSTSLPFILIGVGLAIFCFSTLIWFQTYFRENGVAKIWLYKYSRHPQYLGWIVWSYGILFLPGENLKQNYSISDSLPWLVSTLVIIGVSMVEEIKMSRKFGHEYDKYRKASFFMIPFPKYFCQTISAPFRFFYNKSYPTRKREIVTVLGFYLLLILLVTHLLNINAKSVAPGKWIFELEDSRSVIELREEFITVNNRKTKFKSAKTLQSKGKSSIPIFIDLLSHKDAEVREFSADALGRLISEDAIDPLINSLSDNNWRVVNSVINSLGNYKSEKATNSLISILDSSNTKLSSAAAGVLIRMGSKKAVDAVIPLAQSGIILPNIALISALSTHESEEAESLLLNYLKNNDAGIRQVSVIALRFYNSSITKLALNNMLNDENWEVRLYAEEVLKLLQST